VITQKSRRWRHAARRAWRFPSPCAGHWVEPRDGDTLRCNWRLIEQPLPVIEQAIARGHRGAAARGARRRPVRRLAGNLTMLSEQLQLFRLPSPPAAAKTRHLLISGRIVDYRLKSGTKRLTMTIDERGLRIGAPRG
jgi:hypothetical protein